MPLNTAPIGKEVVVESCRMEGNLKRHMDNLGILPGERIIPIARNSGNLIVKVRESRLALNLGVAENIIVSA